MRPIGGERFSILSPQVITDIPADALGGKMEFFDGDLPTILFDLLDSVGDIRNVQNDCQYKQEYQGVVVVHGLTISGPSEAYGLRALLGE